MSPEVLFSNLNANTELCKCIEINLQTINNYKVTITTMTISQSQSCVTNLTRNSRYIGHTIVCTKHNLQQIKTIKNIDLHRFSQMKRRIFNKHKQNKCLLTSTHVPSEFWPQSVHRSLLLTCSKAHSAR